MRAYQLAGIPSCDTRSVALFLNDEYLGCYNLIFYYDEEELGGELYKAFFEDNQDMGNNQPIWSLSKKKFPDDDNMTILANLIASLTTLSDADWRDFVLSHVDIDKFATYLAVHDFLMMNDTACCNYYIAFNGKYYIIPWDAEDCIEYSSKFVPFGDNHLTKRLYSVAEIASRYEQRIKDLFINGGILATLRSEASRIFSEAEGAMKHDPCFSFSTFSDKKNIVADFLSDSGQVKYFVNLYQ